MLKEFNPVRYSVIEEKNPREIVMLIGSGCKWKKCRFCNYHLDCSHDEQECYELNSNTLRNVTGGRKRLEVINSGSFVDLDIKTMKLIRKICEEKEISSIHFECHWMHRNQINNLKDMFKEVGTTAMIKLGVETFDYNLREKVLQKGIEEQNPESIAYYFDEINLLQGIEGQSSDSMINDIEIGLKYFERVCVNIMIENGMPIKPDKRVINEFMHKVYPKYINNDRVDILLHNTDFGVG